jgi:DNA-binding response OmpR family regulator
VTSAATGAESLTLASKGQFKLYLLGEGFEDRTNLDLCQQIRTFDADTPILFCSAWAYPADIDRGLKAGAQAYLTKPCDWDGLAQTIEQLIGKAATQAKIKRTGLKRRQALNTRRGTPRVDNPSLRV